MFSYHMISIRKDYWIILCPQYISDIYIDIYTHTYTIMLCFLFIFYWEIKPYTKIISTQRLYTWNGSFPKKSKIYQLFYLRLSMSKDEEYWSKRHQTNQLFLSGEPYHYKFNKKSHHKGELKIQILALLKRNNLKISINGFNN